MNVEKELKKIIERNKRVEFDKAWETSKTRRLLIAAMTYFVVVILFLITGLPNPFANALIPTGAFVLSTFSLPLIKKMWIENIYK